MHIGLLKAIKIFRSQRALAEALGIKQQAISNWLNRESKIPYPQVMKIVCLTKGAVKADELAPGEDELNQSFYDMIQESVTFQLKNQSHTVTPTEQNHSTVLRPHPSIHDAYDNSELLLPVRQHIFLELSNNEERNTMTGNHSNLSSQFWLSKMRREIFKLSVESRFIAFYLMTCPHSNKMGIYYLPLSYIAHDIKIDMAVINKALNELIKVGFCSYDFLEDYIWVHEMAKYQVADHLDEKDRRVKGINAIFRSLPDLIFLKNFYKKYKDAFHLSPRNEISTVSNDISTETHTLCVINEEKIPFKKTAKPSAERERIKAD